MSQEDEDKVGEPLIEELSDGEPDTAQNSSKRKREDDAKPQSKRAAKKRKQTKKPKDVDDDALDTEQGVNHAIAHMD
ncbi:hypothetical protein KC352_g38498, partial [Hortaea werneckii]